MTFTLNFDTPIAQFLDTLDILYERSPSASVHTLSCVSWRGGRDRMERVGGARRRGELDGAMIGLMRERQLTCERGRCFDMGKRGAGPRRHRPGEESGTPAAAW